MYRLAIFNKWFNLLEYNEFDVIGTRCFKFILICIPRYDMQRNDTYKCYLFRFFYKLDQYFLCYPWKNKQMFKYLICYLVEAKYLWLHLKPLWSLHFDGKRSTNMWRRHQSICILVILIYDLFSIHTSTRKNTSRYCSVTYVKKED